MEQGEIQPTVVVEPIEVPGVRSLPEAPVEPETVEAPEPELVPAA